MRYITEKEVSKYLQMKDTIDILEDAFVEYHNGNAAAEARIRTMLDGKVLNSMPAIISKYKIAGLKAYFASRTGAKFVVVVFNTETNELEAILEADELGRIRTGALTAMVSRKIVKDKNPPVTIIGSGYQAETQLEGLLNVFEPEYVFVYSRNNKNANSFATRMSGKFGIDITVANTARDAISKSRVINTITTSNSPIFSFEDLGDEFHINLAGANLPFRREVDNSVLEGSEMVIVEHLEQSAKESAEIMDYLSSNGKGNVLELRDFVTTDSTKEIRKSVFKSMGIGLEDLAVAYVVMKKMGIR